MRHPRDQLARRHRRAAARRIAFLLPYLVLLSSCSTSEAPPPPLTAHDLLLATAPAHFTGSVDTNLSLDQAASSLSTDPTPTRTQLSSLGYQDGSEKVWVRGNEYVIDLVLEFNSAVGPGSLVAFERSQLSARPAVTLFGDGDVPGAQGIDISAVTRVGGRQVFCEGAVFPLDRYMFEVEDCNQGPSYSADPLPLTRAQYERAAKLLGLPMAPPSATASATPTPG
jgi:hypothetical protein